MDLVLNGKGVEQVLLCMGTFVFHMCHLTGDYSVFKYLGDPPPISSHLM